MNWPVFLTGLRQSWRTWAGALVVYAVTACCLGVLIGVLGVGMTGAESAPTAASRHRYADLVNLGGFVGTLTGVTAAVCVSSVVGLAVEQQRRIVGLWKVVGMLPQQAFWFVMRQSVVVSMVGGAVGAGLAFGSWSGAIGWLAGVGMAPTSAMGEHAPAFVLIGAASVVVVSVAGTVPTAWRANRVPPLGALAIGERVSRRLTWMRVGCALVAGAFVVASADTSPGDSIGAATSLPMFALLTSLVMLAALSTLIVPGLAAALAGLTPWRLLPEVRIALASVSSYPHRLSSSVIPTTIAVSMMVGLTSQSATLRASLTASGQPISRSPAGIADIFVTVGPAVVIATITAGASLFMTSPQRRGVMALTGLSGATALQQLVQVLSEGMVVALLGVLLAVPPLVLQLGLTVLRLQTVLGASTLEIAVGPLAIILAVVGAINVGTAILPNLRQIGSPLQRDVLLTES